MESLTAFLASKHPALVHVPLGLVVCLPIMVAAAFRSRYPQTWRRMAFRVAGLALALSLLTMLSGLFWGRKLNLVPAGAWIPPVPAPGQALLRILRGHEGAAALGWVLGLLTVAALRTSYRRPERWSWTALSLATSLAWAGAWGYAGKLGGVLVFGDEETNKAAAAALEAKKGDQEADLPIRALDYAGCEPGQAKAFPSRAHGGRLARTWVPASAIDAYREGRPLPVGSYAVLSTVDAQGDPGPLYFREVRKDGTQAFGFYWARVPEGARKETGGEDFAYWRSPDPRLQACAACHRDPGPAAR